MTKNAELALKVLEWSSNNDVGCSSATMASIAVGLKKPFYGDYFSAPRDPSDFRRCMTLVDTIPEIKDHFPVIKKKCKQFAVVIDNWDLLCETLRIDMETNKRCAQKTWDLMKDLGL